MLGAIIGDIVGSRFEFDNIKSREFELFTDDCFPTDDSIMSLAVAKALMETELSVDPGGILFDMNPKYQSLLRLNTIKYLREIGRMYPSCGYGGMFRNWVFTDKPEPYGSYGNGAAMRISPVGYAARTKFESMELSGIVTSVTHDHEEGMKGAEATAVAVFMARRGYLKSEIKKVIESEYYPLDFTVDSIRDEYSFNETCQGTVPQAIRCFLESNSFEDAIRTAISIGGDSDTVGAITGAIAGTYYGIPAAICDKALSYLDDYLLDIYWNWVSFQGKGNNQFKVLTKYIGYFSERFLRDYDYHYDHERTLNEFVSEYLQFENSHPEFGLAGYRDILKQYDIPLEIEDINSLDFDELAPRCILAVIAHNIASERFSGGHMTGLATDGILSKMLTALSKKDTAFSKGKITEITLAFNCFGSHDIYQYILSGANLYEHRHESMSRCYSRRYSVNETKELLEEFESLFFESWKPKYLTPWNIQISDGIHWSLFVRRENDRGTLVIGDNAYPKCWDRLMEVMGIEWEEESERPPGIHIFCSVSFFEGGNTYFYLTEDGSIKAGDRVVVPVGKENIEKTGYVAEVLYCTPCDIPYPIDKTKHIIGKAPERDCGDTDYGSIVVHSSTNENGSTKVWARIKDGCLEIEGQDLGVPFGFFDGEYECFYSFDPEQTRLFAKKLTGRPDDLDLFLKRFKGKFKGPEWLDEFTCFCEKHDLKYTGFSC